jgi:acetyl esterase/lipase
MKKTILWIVGIVIVLGLAGAVFYQVSPWPSALLVRYTFEWDGRKTVEALAKHVPPGVTAERNVRYAEADPDALLDVFYPSALAGTDRILPTIVWVHGGAWVSGDKADMGNYLQILAEKGYTTVSVGYSIAPGAIYPTPVRQANEALAFLVEKGAALHIDASRLVLAGDSAGAQIAAQVANIVSAPEYAEAVGIKPGIERDRLLGAILFCGAYNVDAVNFEGSFAGFLRTVLWSYSGTADFLNDKAFDTVSVSQYVTGAFPPAFISAGNADPLAPQSVGLADALTSKGVAVDSLFFPTDAMPGLPHEYQFNLDTEAGQQALTRTLAFLSRVLPAG